MTSNQKSKQPKSSHPKTPQDQEIDKILVKGEEVILKAEIHGAIYWKSVAILIFAFFVGLFILPLGILLGIVGAILLCIAILTKHFLLLVVTNKRILARYGLLQMDFVDIRLSHVESIDLEHMLPGHIFGYANVVVMGTGQRLIRVPYVSNSDEFRRYYNEIVLANEGSVEPEIRTEKSVEA